MRIIPLHDEIEEYLEARNLIKKFEKARRLFEQNPFHPGLGTELLEPRRARIWSFRIDRKYRALFIFRGRNKVEILTVTLHYQ